MKILSLVTFYFMSLSLLANDSIVGTWKTIDDETGKAKSLVKIIKKDGIFTGNIIKLFNPSEANPVCKNCTDDRKDQAIIGMQIIRDVKQKNDNKWSGGKILDPKKGNEYKVVFRLQEEGQQLKVRGYVGITLLGRTQIWERVDDKN